MNNMSDLRDYLEAHPELEELSEEELDAHLAEAEALTDVEYEEEV